MWMEVRGDLRFASHHDMMRVIERALLRGSVPLRYSRGFNPHPILSLVCAKPVGVAARRDLLVVSPDAAVTREELLEAANLRCPEGLRFLDAKPLEGKTGPVPARCAYEMDIPPDKVQAVTEAMDRFSRSDTFCVKRTRTKTPSRRRAADRPQEDRTIDLKMLVCDVRIAGLALCWNQAPHGSLWARPGEFLQALGLDPRCDLARVTRKDIEFQDHPFGGEHGPKHQQSESD